MTTLHIENTVHDFEQWQEAFDRFERFRADHGVRSYRVSRQVQDPNRITIDLHFDSRELAEAFVPKLMQIWATPQSRRHLVAHAAPELFEVVRDRTLASGRT